MIAAAGTATPARSARLFGAERQPDGSTTFRVWAPSARAVEVELEDPGRPPRHHPLQPAADGWHTATLSAAPAGTRYRYRIDGARVPDPASRYQPDDIHGASVVVDETAYAWQDQAWRGRPWHEAVVYELHVGTFTPEGTFASATARLADLAELGITAVELMPVAEFPGRRNWGYDGAMLFAPDAVYGTPDELKAFVDRAHGLGLMVLLDVVYNHFGPVGNYLHGWCPEFFNPRHQTPWGAAINFDGDHHGPVRRFFVENALHWIEDFHMDGLRLDAVHQIRDDSPLHIVSEIAAALKNGPGRSRPVHLVLENEANDASLLAPTQPGAAPADAQWNDDFHHAAHVSVTGEHGAHLTDYLDPGVGLIARSLAEGYVFQGQRSAFRGHDRGTPSTHLPSRCFVSFLQNHDQVGNRAFGERIAAVAPAEALEALYACLLLSPHIPMLFMGEEFAASAPFLYFCDFEGDLAGAVAAGRRAEFAGLPGFDDPATVHHIADPNDPETFSRCVLDWDEAGRAPHRERRASIRHLLALRRTHLTPRLAGQHGGGRYRVDGAALQVAWPMDGGTWHLLANLGGTAATLRDAPSGEKVFHRHAAWGPAGVELGPWGVLVVAAG